MGDAAPARPAARSARLPTNDRAGPLVPGVRPVPVCRRPRGAVPAAGPVGRRNRIGSSSARFGRLSALPVDPDFGQGRKAAPPGATCRPTEPCWAPGTA